jgi:hypothetical protein
VIGLVLVIQRRQFAGLTGKNLCDEQIANVSKWAHSNFCCHVCGGEHTCFANTANHALFRFSLSDPVARSPKYSSPKAIELRRASWVADSQVVGLGFV